MPAFKLDLDFIPVPSGAAEFLFTETNGAYIRIYLYALFLAAKGKTADNAQIASELNLLESDVMNAFSYWKGKGLIDISDNSMIINNSFSEDIAEKNDAEPAFEYHPERKSAEVIQKIMEEDKSLSDLCLVSQEILGRVLKKNEIETIYWFYDGLGFSPDVISILLEYCVSINKTNIGYIEKVAIGWHENGINSMEAAMEFLENEENKKSSNHDLKRMMGINDRNFTGIEEKFINDWTKKYNMSNEMIVLAYEYCIMRTNKISFPYMDSIIKNWHKKNITTVEAAKKDQEAFKAKNKKFEQKDTSIYDKGDYTSDMIDRLMREKYN